MNVLWILITLITQDSRLASFVIVTFKATVLNNTVLMFLAKEILNFESLRVNLFEK